MGPEYYAKLLAVVPYGLWIVKLTNLAAETNKFHRVFPRAWSIVGLKDYFIQQDLHAQVALKTQLKLIKIRQTWSFSEPNWRQRAVFMVRDSS